MNDDHCLNIDFEELGSFDYQYIELKSTAKERAAQRGAREDNDSRDGDMSMSVFRALLKHVRAHYPVEHTSRSISMVLNLIMLRITSVLSTPDKPVVCVPERSWIHAATYGTKPYLPDGLVHHMLVRASNNVAEAIVAHAIMFTERMKMDTVDVAHIFEAKTREGFLLAAEYVITLLKQWCQITGKAHARAVLTYQYTWQFYSYHAPVDGRKARVQYLRDLRFRLTLDDIDTILGLLLDLVQNTSEERQEYFTPLITPCPPN